MCAHTTVPTSSAGQSVEERRGRGPGGMCSGAQSPAHSWSWGRAGDRATSGLSKRHRERDAWGGRAHSPGGRMPRDLHAGQVGAGAAEALGLFLARLHSGQVVVAALLGAGPQGVP